MIRMIDHEETNVRSCVKDQDCPGKDVKHAIGMGPTPTRMLG
jgi:hypothetical protein